MVLYNKNKFKDMVVDGHKTSVLKISEDFEYQLNGDELIIKSPVRLPWYHEQSPYRYVVTIHSDFDDVDGFQVNLSELYKNTDLNTRDDIFVYDKEGNLINHWLKPDDGEFWIKLPLQAGDINTICVYFGSGISNLGNGDNVFEFFDDFEGDSLDTNKWGVIGNPEYSVSNGYLRIGSAYSNKIIYSKYTLLENYVFEIKYNNEKGDHDTRIGINGDISNLNYVQCLLPWEHGDSRIDQIKGGSFSGSHYKTGLSCIYGDINTVIKVKNNVIKSITINNDIILSNLTVNRFGNYFGLTKDTEDNVYFDYVFVRKYADKEPYIINYKKQSKD